MKIITNIEELQKYEKDIAEVAEEFYASSETLVGFNITVFMRSWQQIFESGRGVIFLLEEDGKAYGGLGGCWYPDLNSGDMIACELFWYVRKERRGKGLLLLNAFEEWTKLKGCKYIHVVYLTDLMPDAIRNIYERRGYRLAEMAYRKEV